MPAVSAADLARLRFTKHASLLRLAVYTPAAIWTAQVDGAQTTGDGTVTVKNVVPTARAAGRHYQVLIGSTAGGREYGEARYEDYAAPTLTLGAHNCELPNNAYVTVLEEIKPLGIQCTMDASDVVYEDGGLAAYTDENLNYHPLARCGPPAVAFRDETTGIATVNFYGNAVPALGLGAGVTITDHAWDFVDGNPAASAIPGTAAVPISVEYATAGERYISYWVEDSNGKTHITHRPVFIFDRYSGALPYSQIEITGMEGDVDAGGWTCNLAVWTDAPTSAFPPQALCVVFAEDWYGAEKVSIGGHYTYRENIVLVGYIRRGTTRKDWARGVVEFTVDGIGRVMDNIPGNALSLEASAAPTGWHELDNLCPAMAAYHLLTEHSTIDHICDLHLAPVLYEMDFYDVTEVPMLQQISQEIAGCVRGRVGSNAQGMLYFETNPQLKPLADRTNPTVLSTNFVDLRGEIAFDAEESEKQVSQVDFCGEDADGNPWFSLAPPNPWGQGRWEKVDGIRADTQAESNILAGLYEGYLNNQYANVPVNWRGNYRVFDVFPSEAVNVNITAAQNKRGIVWTEQRCWTKRVSYEYRNTHLLVSSVIEKDSYGAAGKTGEYPEEPPDIVIPPPDVQPDPYEPPPVDFPDGDEIGEFRSKVYVPTATNGVYYTADFTGVGGAMPTWTTANTGLPATNLRAFTADPFVPSNRQYCLLGSPNEQYLYRRVGGGNWASCADAQALIVAWGMDIGIGAYIIRAVCPDINVAGYLGAIVSQQAGPTGHTAFYYADSADYGTTWTYRSTLIADHGPLLAINGFGMGLFKGTSAQAAGYVIYMAIGETFGGDTNTLFVSTDRGVTWTQKAKQGVISFVYNDVLQLDPFQDVVYAFGTGAADHCTGLLRSTDQGTNFSSINPDAVVHNAYSTEHAGGYRCVPTYDPASSPKAAVIRLVDTDNDVWKTVNAGAAWTEYTHDATLPAIQLGIYVYSDAEGKLYGIAMGGLVLNDHVVYVSEDEGQTWEGKGGADRGAGTVNGIPWNCGAIGYGAIGILPVYK